MTAPTCHEPLGYGGGVSITYIGWPGPGSKRYESGSRFQKSRTSSSMEGSHAFSGSFASAMRISADSPGAHKRIVPGTTRELFRPPHRKPEAFPGYTST